MLIEHHEYERGTEKMPDAAISNKSVISFIICNNVIIMPKELLLK